MVFRHAPIPRKGSGNQQQQQQQEKRLFSQSVARRTNDTALYTYMKTILTRQISLFVTIAYRMPYYQLIKLISIQANTTSYNSN